MASCLYRLTLTTTSLRTEQKLAVGELKPAQCCVRYDRSWPLDPLSGLADPPRANRRILVLSQGTQTKGVLTKFARGPETKIKPAATPMEHGLSLQPEEPPAEPELYERYKQAFASSVYAMTYPVQISPSRSQCSATSPTTLTRGISKPWCESFGVCEAC